MTAIVYIMASRKNGTLYSGVTNNGPRRIFEHREGKIPGFTKQYGVKILVWYEAHSSIVAAIRREKNIKGWPRRWKLDLINKMNPEWEDLYGHLSE
jgi:putative endonuclease